MRKLESLIQYVQAEGRVCPMPTFWNELYDLLPDKKQKENGGWIPSVPLILAAWWDTTTEEKRERLSQHINYAVEHGVLDKIDKFLRDLKPDQWAYGNGMTTWKEWAKQKAE